MEIFSFLSYINKISLLAFFVVLLVVAYQIYILKKEKTKEQAPLIPNFKEAGKSNEVVNYTNLPGFLLKKESSPINFSNLVFLIIFLLTVIVIIFILVVLKKNNNPPPPPTTTLPKIKTKIIDLSPSPMDLVASPSPTIELIASPSPMIDLVASISPTEIILAKQTLSPTPICTGQACLTPTKGISTPQTLPTTGSIGKGLLIIGAAISTIFFSFWF